MNLKQKKAELLRETILETTIGILENQGAEKVTIREIAQGLGCSIGVIYNYFQDKDEILKEIYIQTCREFLDKLQAFSSSSRDPKEKFVDMVAFMCEFRIKNSVRYREIYLLRLFKSPPMELAKITEFLQMHLKDLRLPALSSNKKIAEACQILLALMEGIANVAKLEGSSDLEQYIKTIKMGIRTLLKGWSQ